MASAYNGLHDLWLHNSQIILLDHENRPAEPVENKFMHMHK